MTDWQSWSRSPVRRERAHLKRHQHALEHALLEKPGCRLYLRRGGLPAGRSCHMRWALNNRLTRSNYCLAGQQANCLPKAESPPMSTSPDESPAARSTAGSNLPTRARVVVIGGGVIGCSVAYHLAQMGCADVVLLERDRLTSGTTWHAAGLMVTFGSTSETSTEMRKYTRDLYSRLEAETGLATGFNPVGFIEIATDLDRLEEYRRVSAFDRYCGVDVQEISAAEVGELFPLARVDDILAGFYVKEDGRANPVDVTMSLAKGARLRGATIIEGVPVTDVLERGGVVTGVRTDHGDIEAEYVVNCAGMWARQLGERSGVTIPLQAAEHYYLLTEPIPQVSNAWPILEDPASHGYFREEGGGLMLGLFEPVCAPWRVEGIPPDFSFGELPPDWDRMGPYLETAMSPAPRTRDIAGPRYGRIRFQSGGSSPKEKSGGIPSTFHGAQTGSNRPIMRPAPSSRKYPWEAGSSRTGQVRDTSGIGSVSR